jgi:hypothetical protein
MNTIFIIILLFILTVFYLLQRQEEKFFTTTSDMSNPIFSYTLKSSDGTKLKINGEDVFWTFELDPTGRNIVYYLGIKNNNGGLNFLTMPEPNKYVLTEEIVNKKKLNMIPYLIMYLGQNNYIFVNLNGIRYYLKVLSNGDLEWTTNVNEASKFTYENN